MSEKESTAATPGQPVASETASEREAIASSTVSLLGSVEQIAARRQAVLKRWSEFKEVAAQRRAKLQDSKKLQQFNRNCEELEAWIASRLKIASEEAHKDPTNLQAKIKKHKTFEAEIHANENALSTVKLSGHELINHGHYAADAIAAKIEFVEEQWALLLERSKLKARKLQEAQALLAFKREVDEVDAWIQSKAEIASSKDVGKDLEHVGMLQKKFDDFTNDLTASDVRVDAVNKMAVDLIRQGHPEQTFIQQRQQAINDAWAALKKQAAQRHELLSNAKQIHAFNRDADEIDSRISEKMAMLSTEDYGKDLASVEALQRKHEVFTRDLAALGDSVASLSDDARRLCTAFPDSAGDVRTKRDAVSQHWEQLSSAARQRKTKLDDAHDLQRFLNDLQSSTSWIADMTSLMSVEETVRDVAGADALLQRHQERHDELQARQANFNAVEEFGSRLILRGHYAAEEVKQRLDALKGERAALDELWKRRQHEFEEARAMQVFLRDTEQVESWLASRESALRTEDLGDSLDTVDALLKKHDDFEKSLAAHEEKTAALQQAAARLATEGHSQAAEIQARCDAVLERRAALVKAAAERRTKLEASKQLQEFKRDADEAEAWMKEKLQAATDGAYKDPTNLRGKIKNHEAFKAELQANESRVTAVQDAGAQLVQQGHYATDYIEQRQRELGNQWATLQEESDTKGQRLEEAHQHQEFSRRVDDMDGWCKDVEKALASEDLGRDLSSVKNLIKKHQLLEADVAGHQERLEAIQRQAKEMMDAGNFQAEAIQAREQALTTRYNAFTQPMQRRKQQLEESLQLQMFLRTLDDELSWIKEKEPLAASTNTGSSLTSVQSLQKKHNALLAELTGRKSHIQDVEKTAQQLVAGGHYAAEQVRQHRDELLQRWRALNSTAQQRTVALDHALQVQQYLADANEAQAWMAEKEPVVTNDNFGKDEDSAQGLLKKHEVVEQDLRAYKGDIERLAEDCRKCQHVYVPDAAEADQLQQQDQQEEQQQQQQQQQPAGAHEEPAATPEPASETQKGSDGGEEDALSFVQRMKVATSKKVAEELQQPDDNQEEQDVKEQGKQPASSPHDPAVPFAAHPQIEFDIEGPNDHAVPGALSKVISPLSLVNLFYTYTDEHPFHIKRVDDYYAGLNSNLSHIDLLLQIHAATAHDEELLSPETNKTQANCAFVKHGMGSLNDKYPDAYHAYLDGCTIVCNIVPAYWQPLAGLMHGVQQETGLAYMANMYLTPRASQGFVEHTDNKDGLIVQTDGRKEWVLKNTKFPMPLRHQMVGRPWERPASTVAADTAAEPLLTAGDVLFIPRGMPHYAKSAGDYPSLHFTVSPTKNLEWVDFYRDIADVSKPFVAARVETLLGDDAPSVQEMLQCMGALADATTAAVAAAAEEPLHYELRRSLPWWYRALAGVTVPSVHSAIGYTVKQCKDRLAQQEADAERVAAVSALVDKLAKGVTMPKVFDLLNLCRPRTPAVPIASVSQCDAVSGKLRAKGIAFLDDLLGDVMEDHELLKTVLPNALKRNSVFVDYTAKLHAKGLEIDPASFSAVALHPTTSVAFTATPWSFQVNKSSITITAGAEAASQPQRVEFRHTPQLEQLLKRVQGLQDGDGASFQLHELATAVSPRDDFEVACLVRVLARLNVLEPAAANKQHAADGDHGEASVPEQYEHLITDTPAPPPVTDTQQQQQQEEKKKEEEEEEEGDEVEIVTDDDGRADENSEPKKD